MDITFYGSNFRTKRWHNDTRQAVQLCCSEQSYNRSPWENDHKSQLVKPILMKPMVLDQGYARLPQWKMSNTEEHNLGDIIETVTCISAEEIEKLGLPVPGAFLHCFQKRSTFDNSIWIDIYLYPIRSERLQVLKIRVSPTNPRSSSSRSRTDTSNR